MHINIDHSAKTPIYQQIVDSISRDIRGGILEAGFRLPTVRDFSLETGASHGTVKHAYDTLEQLGLIQKTQGRGTFVCDLQGDQQTSKKEQAMAAIDSMLDQLQAIPFTMREIRIFVELKLREREQYHQNVRVAAVDCSPEALSVIRGQMAPLPHVDIYAYLLSNVLDAPGAFDPQADLCITTPTHYQEVREKLRPDCKLLRMVLSVSPATVASLARIPPGAAVGVLCASHRFSQVIQETCQRYCKLSRPLQTACLGDDKATQRFLADKEYLILPPGHLSFASRQEQEALAQHAGRAVQIVYQYRIDQGSLLYLEEQIEQIYAVSKSKL